MNHQSSVLIIVTVWLEITVFDFSALIYRLSCFLDAQEESIWLSK